MINPIKTHLDVETNMTQYSSLNYLNVNSRIESSTNFVIVAENLLNNLVDSLENKQLNFDLPYDNTAAEIFRVIGYLDESQLKVSVYCYVGTCEFFPQ